MNRLNESFSSKINGFLESFFTFTSPNDMMKFLNYETQVKMYGRWSSFQLPSIKMIYDHLLLNATIKNEGEME